MPTLRAAIIDHCLSRTTLLSSNPQRVLPAALQTGGPEPAPQGPAPLPEPQSALLRRPVLKCPPWPFALVGRGPRHAIFRATDLARPVVIKQPAAAPATPGALAALRHEYELLRDLDLEGVVRALDRVPTGGGIALVMFAWAERCGGPRRRASMPLPQSGYSSSGSGGPTLGAQPISQLPGPQERSGTGCHSILRSRRGVPVQQIVSTCLALAGGEHRASLRTWMELE